MKKFLYWLGLTFFLFLFSSQKNAAAWEKLNCSFGGSVTFDINPQGKIIAVGKNEPGTLQVLIAPFLSGEEKDYEIYIYYNQSWFLVDEVKVAPYGPNGPLIYAVLKNNVSFPEIKNYRLALYARSKINNSEYYCGDGEAWVYGLEEIKTGYWWPRESHFVSYPENPVYTSPEITSTSGYKIAGIKVDLSFFEENSFGGYYKFLPSQKAMDWDRSTKIGLIFSENQEAEKIYWQLVAPECDGCWVRAFIGDPQNIKVYTRQENILPAEPSPVFSSPTPTPTLIFIKPIPKKNSLPSLLSLKDNKIINYFKKLPHK